MREATVDQLRAALDEAERLIAAVPAEGWSAETPCPEWDVRTLVSHLIAGNHLFAAALRGQDPAPHVPDTNLVAAFANSASELLTAFAGPDTLQRVVQVPFGTVSGEVALHLRITEILVHGWDIAGATDQDANFDETVVLQELQFSRGALAAIPPDRRPFAAPEEPPPGASALETLAALLGRKFPTTD